MNREFKEKERGIFDFFSFKKGKEFNNFGVMLEENLSNFE